MKDKLDIQFLVSRLQENLTQHYGNEKFEVCDLAKASLSVWEATRKSIYLNDADISVIPINDPGYRWLRRCLKDLVLPDVMLPPCAESCDRTMLGWRGNGFNFPLLIHPGADGEDMLLCIAEAMKTLGQADWLMAQNSIDRELLEGANTINALRRKVWAGIEYSKALQESILQAEISSGSNAVIRHAIEREDRTGEYSMKENFAPVFICLQGENISDHAVYEMQDLTNRLGCRFLVFGCSEDPEHFHLHFGDGVEPYLFERLPPVKGPEVTFNPRKLMGELALLISDIGVHTQSADNELLDLRVPFMLSTTLVETVESTL